jgi:hypothetical protein
MTNTSRVQPQARDFMRYMGETFNFIEMFRQTKRLPARRDAPDFIREQVPEIAQILNIPEFAFPVPNVGFWPEVRMVVARSLNGMFAGIHDYRGAAAWAEAEIMRVIRDNQ